MRILGILGRLWALAAVALPFVIIPVTATTTSSTIDTTTTLPTSTEYNATACTARVKTCRELYNYDDACLKTAKEIECFGESGQHGCNVVDRTAPFPDVQSVFATVCPAIPTDCLDLTFCLSDTEHGQLQDSVDNAVGPNETQAADLTNAHFWCKYMNDSIDCATKHSTDCNVPEHNMTIVESVQYWLAPTCNGQDTTVPKRCSDHVTNCMRATQLINGTQNCTEQKNQVSCASSARNFGCTVRELGNVTFDNLTDIHANVCTVANPVLRECPEMWKCMEAQYYEQIPGLHTNDGPPPIVYPSLLSSTFWCSHLNQTCNCYLKHARDCGVSVREVNEFENKTVDHIRKLCAGELGGGLDSGASTSIHMRLTNNVLVLVFLLLSGPVWIL